MVAACAPSAAAGENPGVVLGTILGVAAKRFGRDKLTIVASPPIASLGAWLEQLVCRIHRQGRQAVSSRSIASRSLHRSCTAAIGSSSTCACDPLPTRRRTRPSPRWSVRVIPSSASSWTIEYDLGQEFFRWEIATAVAGSILGIHPFDQPDVEASKVETRKLTDEYERAGTLPAEVPLCSDGDVALFADARNAAALNAAVGKQRTLAVVPRGSRRAIGRRRLSGAARLRRDERGARACAAGDPHRGA